MPIGCLICDEALESPAPVPVADASCPDAGGAVKVKKTKSVAKRPPATVNDNVVTPCGHIFHELCLDQWFKNKSSTTCPVCRKSFTKAKLIRVFPSQVEEDMDSSSKSKESTQGEGVNTAIHPSSQGQGPPSLYSNTGIASSSKAENLSQTTGVIKFVETNQKWPFPVATTFHQHSSPSYYNVSPAYAMAKSVQSQSTSSGVLPNQYLSGSGDSLYNANSYYRGTSVPQSVPYHLHGGSTSSSTSVTQQGNVSFNASHQQYDSNFSYTPPQIMPYAPALPPYALPSAVEISTSQHRDSHSSNKSGIITNAGQAVRTDDVQRHGNFPTNGMGTAGFCFNSSNNTNTSSVPSASTQLLSSGSNSGYSTTRQTDHSPRNHSLVGAGQSARTNNSHLSNKYEELNVIHQTLVADYNELQQKYNDSKDEIQLLIAQLESSKDEIKRLQESAKRTIINSSVSLPEVLNPEIAGSGSIGSQKRSHDGLLVTPGPSVANAGPGSSSSTNSHAKQDNSHARLDNNMSNPSMFVSTPSFTFINPFLSTARDQNQQFPRFYHTLLDPRSQRLPEIQPTMNSLMDHTPRPSTQSPVLIGNSN